MNETNLNHKSDWRAVEIDETYGFVFKDDHAKYIKRIMAVYLFDRNNHTYCCEMTPSYWMMIGLYHYIVFNDDVSGEVRDHINETEYEQCAVEDCYMHVGSVNKFATREYKQPDEDDLTEDVVREYWQGNYPY